MVSPRIDAINLVKDCLHDIYSTIAFGDYEDIQFASYYSSSLKDILRGLIKTKKSPLIFLEDYRDQMDEFYKIKKNLIFDVGGSVAQYLIDLLVE